MPGYTTVSVEIQRVFVRTLDVVVDTQHKHLCLSFYMSVPPPFVFCSPKGTIMKIRSISDLYYAIPATVS